MNVAVLGATGAVGVELLDILERRQFPLADLRLLASERSAGKQLPFVGRTLTVQAVGPHSFEGINIALFSAGTAASREFAAVAVRGGTMVVDNSSAFRMDDNVPLVIPEINARDLAAHQGIVANPNCTTIIMLMAVGPIHRVFPIKRIVVSTYQSVSGAGRRAMEELRSQTRAYLEGQPIQPQGFRHPIAFNLFSHDSAIGENGYNGEEQKMIDETRKILHQHNLAVAPTCVRVPIMRAHSASINLEFHEPVIPQRVREVLEAASGVKVVDDRSRGLSPMPVDASGQDDVLVGRIRADISRPGGRGMELFVCGDQLRKGAALNAVQIAERLAGITADV